MAPPPSSSPRRGTGGLLLPLLSLLLLASFLPRATGLLRSFHRGLRTQQPTTIATATSTATAISSSSSLLSPAPVMLAPAVDEKELSTSERLSRALRFYQSAVPIFASYWLKEQNIKWRRSTGEIITAKQEEDEYTALHDTGSDELVAVIKELSGYYVKTGQILSTRKDIFPSQYTEKLAVMQDALDPLPGHIIKDIVRRELLEGAELSDLFASFDDECLGSASIAQVHKATLLDGRVVAVKVQRPSISGKLLGDIANLKQFAKVVAAALPIDYYKVFCELERTLVYELDFLHEAQAASKMASAVAHRPNNTPLDSPAVTIPLPIPGLVSKRVLVMEYIEGTPLSRLTSEMAKLGITAGSAESLLLGRKLLSSLTDAYAAMIFGSGILHGDPHPGNIFILPRGDICLLDCGQVKTLTTGQKIGLAELVVQVNDWEIVNNKLLSLLEGSSSSSSSSSSSGANANTKNTNTNTNTNINTNAVSVSDLQQQLQTLTVRLAERVRSFGVQFKDGVGDDCAAAVAILLFGNTGTKLPGGYAGEEVSPDSPIVQVKEFPQELVLLGRATVLIKGIANRLGLSWGLSDRWSSVAREAISASLPAERQPVWAATSVSVALTGSTAQTRVPDGRKISINGNTKRVNKSDLLAAYTSFLRVLRYYLYGKLVLVGEFLSRFLPESVRVSVRRVGARVAVALAGKGG